MSSGQQSRLSSSLLVDQHQRTIIRQLLRNTKNIETQLDIIVKEFTKPSEKTNVERLMGVLEAISRNQPEAREAYSEVKNNVYNMEPFEMLDTFLNTYQFRCEVRRSREFTTAPPDAADGNNEGLIYTFNTLYISFIHFDNDIPSFQDRRPLICRLIHPKRIYRTSRIVFWPPQPVDSVRQPDPHR